MDGNIDDSSYEYVDDTESPSEVGTSEKRAQNVESDEAQIEAPTYYPVLPRGERHTASKPPNHLRFEQAQVTIDDGNDAKYLLKNYEDDISIPNSAKWLVAMKFDFDSLTSLGT